jgi:hypothetical protein
VGWAARWGTTLTHNKVLIVREVSNYRRYNVKKKVRKEESIKPRELVFLEEV